MRTSRRLATLILIDAILTVAVVHRAQQHTDAYERRQQAVSVIGLAERRHQAMR